MLTVTITRKVRKVNVVSECGASKSIANSTRALCPEFPRLLFPTIPYPAHA